jgi:hypothetical protein
MDVITDAGAIGCGIVCAVILADLAFAQRDAQYQWNEM